MLKAQELQLLDLNDDINRYLPFEIINPRFHDAKITIRHLSNHTSSLRDTKHYEKSYVFVTPISKIYKNFPFGLKRLVAKHIVKGYNKNKEIPLSEFLQNIYMPDGRWYSKKSFGKEPPGEAVSYSNNGAAIASLIIEQVSGMNYTDFIDAYILKPLEMRHSGWEPGEFDKDQKSKLYPFYMEIPNYKLITIADGGFITCVDDFSKYLANVIRGYKGEDNLISSESYDIMLKDNLIKNEAVFWESEQIDNQNYIGHRGGDPGIQTVAIFNIESGLGYIGFSNTNTESSEELDKALEIMIHYAPQLQDEAKSKIN